MLPTHVALALLGVLHLLVIVLGMGLLAKRLGLGPAAATLAILTFTLRGTVRSWFALPPLLEVAAWVPLGCVAILDLARAPRPRSIALLAAVTAASWLAGGPQATIYLLYGWAAFVAAALAAVRARAARWVVVPLLVASGLVLRTLAAGVQLGPSLEMANEGTRATARLARERLFPLGVLASPAPAGGAAGLDTRPARER